MLDSSKVLKLGNGKKLSPRMRFALSSVSLISTSLNLFSGPSGFLFEIILISLSLLSQAVVFADLQWCQLITCLVPVKPRQLVPLESMRPLLRHTLRCIAPAGPVQDQRQSHPHLRQRQRRRHLFSPDGPR
jgi:hypothetical protein